MAPYNRLPPGERLPLPHPESFRTVKANGSRAYLLKYFQWTEEQYDEGSDYIEERFQEAAKRPEKPTDVYSIDHMSEGPAQDLMNDIYKDFFTAKPDLNRHVPGSNATWEKSAIHLLARLVRDKKRRQMKTKLSRNTRNVAKTVGDSSSSTPVCARPPFGGISMIYLHQDSTKPTFCQPTDLLNPDHPLSLPDISDFDREQKIQKGDLDFETLKTLLRVERNLRNDDDEIWFNGKRLVEERNWQMAIKGAYEENRYVLDFYIRKSATCKFAELVIFLPLTVNCSCSPRPSALRAF